MTLYYERAQGNINKTDSILIMHLGILLKDATLLVKMVD